MLLKKFDFLIYFWGHFFLKWTVTGGGWDMKLGREGYDMQACGIKPGCSTSIDMYHRCSSVYCDTFKYTCWHVSYMFAKIFSTHMFNETILHLKKDLSWNKHA